MASSKTFWSCAAYPALTQPGLKPAQFCCQTSYHLKQENKEYVSQVRLPFWSMTTGREPTTACRRRTVPLSWVKRDRTGGSPWLQLLTTLSLPVCLKLSDWPARSSSRPTCALLSDWLRQTRRPISCHLPSCDVSAPCLVYQPALDVEQLSSGPNFARRR